MGRLIYIILVACVCCTVMSACGKLEDNDELSKQDSLYGVTEDELFKIGAQIYDKVSDELPNEYMISEKIDIVSQELSPRCMAYATAMAVNYLDDDISGDEVYYEFSQKGDNGGVKPEVAVEWINERGKQSAQLYMGTLDALKTSVCKDVPVIICGSGSAEEYRPHAYLVTGYDEEFIYIADSAHPEAVDYYNRKVTYEEFEAMWGPENEDDKFHHLFIEVVKADDETVSEATDTKTGAFETIGTKEYDAVGQIEIEASGYELLDITENYIVLTQRQEAAKEHFFVLEFYMYDLSSNQLIKLGDSIEYLGVIEPSYAKVNGNYIAGVIQHDSNGSSVLNYYNINPEDLTIEQMGIQGEPASNTLFAWNESDMVSFYNNKLVLFDLNNGSRTDFINYSAQEVYIETAAAYKDRIYLVEAFRESGVDYVDIGQLDRVLREYDEEGNICSETQLKPIVDILGITSEIKKIIVGDKYAVLEDENEHVVILKKTDTGYEMDSKHLLNPKHYVSVMDYEGNMVCLKSSVDDSFYLFDMGKGEMYDLKLAVDGVETVMIGEDKMLLQADGELYVVEFRKKDD